jgi:hypothetical protein
MRQWRTWEWRSLLCGVLLSVYPGFLTAHISIFCPYFSSQTRGFIERTNTFCSVRIGLQRGNNVVYSKNIYTSLYRFSKLSRSLTVTLFIIFLSSIYVLDLSLNTDTSFYVKEQNTKIFVKLCKVSQTTESFVAVLQRSSV